MRALRQSFHRVRPIIRGAMVNFVHVSHPPRLISSSLGGAALVLLEEFEQVLRGGGQGGLLGLRRLLRGALVPD